MKEVEGLGEKLGFDAREAAVVVVVREGREVALCEAGDCKGCLVSCESAFIEVRSSLSLERICLFMVCPLTHRIAWTQVRPN